MNEETKILTLKNIQKFLCRKKTHEGEKDIHFSSTNSERSSNESYLYERPEMDMDLTHTLGIIKEVS